MAQQSIITHDILGKINVVRKFYISTMEYEFKCAEQAKFKIWEQSITKVKQNLKTKCLLIPTSIQKTDTDYSMSIRAKLKFQEFIYLFEKQKNNRIKLQKKFLETQLWFILYQVAEASKELQQKNSCIGIINQNTMLFNEYGYIKILCKDYSLYNYDQIIKQKFIKGSYNFVKSPQQIIAGDNPTLNIALTRTKTQAFSLGITLLHFALLKNIDNFYYPNGKFNQQYLKVCLFQLKQTYSQFFYNVIVLMTTINSHKRMSTGQIWAILKPYQQQIFEMQSFKVNSQRCQQSLKSYLKELKNKGTIF